jgi:hypothetical protein
MSGEQPHEIVNRVFREWADEARRGRPSNFRGWTFFETNCFSELLKQTRDGRGDAVRQFLRGRDVLLPGTVLGEIIAAPDLARRTLELLSSANFFLVADVSKFWECDLWNFITMGRHARDVLETRLLSENFLSGLFAHDPFVDVVKQSRVRVAAEYHKRVEPDIAAKLDERDLGSVIWSRIDSMAVDWLKLEIPPADVRPERFPAFFTFYYSYFFRYIKSQTRAQVNDFNDLLNTVAAPYCCDYFGERTVAGILKNDVQGRIPPRPIEVARRLNKTGFLPSETLTRAEATPDQTSSNGSLLPDTRIWTINDLRQQLSRSL